MKDINLRVIVNDTNVVITSVHVLTWPELLKRGPSLMDIDITIPTGYQGELVQAFAHELARRWNAASE